MWISVPSAYDLTLALVGGLIGGFIAISGFVYLMWKGIKR